MVASRNSDGTDTDAGAYLTVQGDWLGLSHPAKGPEGARQQFNNAVAATKTFFNERDKSLNETDRALLMARGDKAVDLAKKLGFPMGDLRRDLARADAANSSFNKDYIASQPKTWEEKYRTEGLPFSDDWSDLQHFGSHQRSPIEQFSRVGLVKRMNKEPFFPEAPSVPKPTNKEPFFPEAPSVPKPTVSAPSPPPYSVMSERAQYEEDNFLPYAPPPPPVGPAPVPMSPSDFTMIDGQIVPKQPAPAKPHPYANAPSVPPPVDQRYYEPLDTTSQGFNLPQYIQVPERYPHPSEQDIDYRISRMYPGPVLPNQSPAPVPQTSVPTPQANPVMGAVQGRTQGIRSELEAMRVKDAAKEQIVRDWENKLISLEEMERRLIQIERGPAGPSIPIPQP